MTAHLPHADPAIVDIRKLEDYCLNDAHPRGRHKGRVFRAVRFRPGLSPVGYWNEDEEASKVSLSVILCARHNRREGAYYAEQSEEGGS
jgi:hypothetical protein